MDTKLIYRLQDNLLFLIAEGDYSAREFLELLKDALNDPRIRRRFGIVIDVRNSEIRHRIADIKSIYDELKKWNERIARIAVVVQSALHYGFTRQYSVYAEFAGQEINPFYRIEPAIDWVNEKFNSDPEYNNAMYIYQATNII
jgi:hypothetical protein